MNDYVGLASQYWQRGHPLVAGLIIFEHLPAQFRPLWARDILNAVVQKCKINSEPINNILHISEHPEKWQEAKKAFSPLRDLSLQMEKEEPLSKEDDLLLHAVFLAELVAKVTYSATEPPDPYDEDTGWWIPLSLDNFLECLGDPDFSRSSRSVWLLLRSKYLEDEAWQPRGLPDSSNKP